MPAILTTSAPPTEADVPPPRASAVPASPAAGRHDAFFRTDHLKGELKRRAVRGGAVTMLSQIGKFALNLGSTFVLARLLKLGPGDYGLIAMVATVTGLIRVFNDLGLSRATVQRAEVNHEQVTALFWVNAAVGAAGMLLAVALAPLVASFYGEPRLLPVMAALSAGFVFSGLGAQHQALMTRQMRFAGLAMIDMGALAAGVGAAIFTAWRGGGYWALVALSLVSALVQNVAVWIASGWVPGLPRRGAGVGAMLKFGANLAGFNLVNYLQRNADNVLIGRTLGAGALGLYDKAYHLLMMPIHQVNQPMSNIAVPSLSRLQDDPARFRNYYRNAIQALVTVTMPAVVLLFVVTDEVVLTLLGRHWLGAVPIFRWLAPAALVGTFHVATGWVYVSLGRTDRQLRMGLVVAPITIGGFVVGSFWGPVGVAASYSVTSLLLRYPTVAYCFRGTPLRPADLAAAIWRPALASGLAGVGLFVFEALLLQSGHSAARLLLQFVTYGVLYVFSWCVLPGGRRFLFDSFRLLGNLKGGAAGGPAVSSREGLGAPGSAESRAPEAAPAHEHSAAGETPEVDGGVPAARAIPDAATAADGDAQPPLVSVIIPVRNDAQRLGLCLRSLADQDYPADRYEVIVVDNGSDPQQSPGPAVAACPAARLVSETAPGSYAARNKGLTLARGEVLAFTDADCLPDRGWVRSGVDALQRQAADLVGGEVSFTFADPNRRSAAEVFDSVSNMQIKRDVQTRALCKTANLFARRRVFDAIGPFPAGLKSGGDVYWTKKATDAGFKLVYSPAARVRHPARGLGELLAKNYRVGGGQPAVWLAQGKPAWRVLARVALGFRPPPLRQLRDDIRSRAADDAEPAAAARGGRLARVWGVAWLSTATVNLGRAGWLLSRGVRGVPPGGRGPAPSRSGAMDAGADTGTTGRSMPLRPTTPD